MILGKNFLFYIFLFTKFLSIFSGENNNYYKKIFFEEFFVRDEFKYSFGNHIKSKKIIGIDKLLENIILNHKNNEIKIILENKINFKKKEIKTTLSIKLELNSTEKKYPFFSRKNIFIQGHDRIKLFLIKKNINYINFKENKTKSFYITWNKKENYFSIDLSIFSTMNEDQKSYVLLFLNKINKNNNDINHHEILTFSKPIESYLSDLTYESIILNTKQTNNFTVSPWIKYFNEKF